MLYKKRYRGNKNSTISAINITPFVDVMLVLLVVFMATSPMLMSNVDINLPKSQGSIAEQKKEEPLVLVINKNGNIYIKDNIVTNENLLHHIELWSYGSKDINIHIHGDQHINYGKIMDTISLINSAGYNKVSLVAVVEGN